jgi:hypothetical protein
VVGVAFENACVCRLGGVVLYKMSVDIRQQYELCSTYVFLLLVHVTNLEPNVFLAERLRRIGDNVAEAL